VSLSIAQTIAIRRDPILRMMTKWIAIFLQLLPALLACRAMSQDSVVLKGFIFDLDTKDKVRAGELNAVDLDDTLFVLSKGVDGRGRFSFALPYDRQLLVRFVIPDRVAKSMIIDTRGVPALHREGGHGLEMKISTLYILKGVDYSGITGIPFGICRFDTMHGGFIWDVSHLEMIRDEWGRVREAHLKKRKELGLR